MVVLDNNQQQQKCYTVPGTLQINWDYKWDVYIYFKQTRENSL